MLRPAARQVPADRLQRTRAHQRLAGYHQRAHRDQRLVPEAEKQVAGLKQTVATRVGKYFENQQQSDHDQQARGSQRHALTGKQQQRKTDQRHHRVGMEIGVTDEDVHGGEV